MDDIKINDKKYNKRQKLFDTNDVERASLIILDFIFLKYSELSVMHSSDGRLSDLYVFKDISKSLAVQVKATVQGGVYNFKFGTEDYKGMIIVCIDFNKTLLDTILEEEDTLTSNDLKQGIRYISILPWFQLRQTDKHTLISETDVQDFKVNYKLVPDKFEEYLKQDFIVKRSVVEWDLICKSSTHFTGFQNLSKLIYYFKQHDLCIINTISILPFDGFLEFNNSIYALQSLLHMENITLQSICDENMKDTQYTSLTTNLIIIHNNQHDVLKLFIPAAKLNRDALQSKNKYFSYNDYINYELDITAPKFISNLGKIIQECTSTFTLDDVSKYKLTGFKFRQSDNYISETYKIINHLSHEDILEEYKNLIEFYYNEFGEIYTNVKVKGWPKTCPLCDYKNSHHMGRHIKAFHPEILNNYNVSSTRGKKDIDKKFKCSYCKKKFTTPFNTRNHIKASKKCKKNSARFIRL